MEKLFKSMKEGEEWFYKCFGKGETFDATARSIHLWDMPALLLYINGLVDGNSLLTLLTKCRGVTVGTRSEEDENDYFLSFFPYHSVTAVKDHR